MFAPNIIPTKRAELSKINERRLRKKLTFRLNEKKKKKKKKKKENLLFFSVNTKNISSHVLTISAISLVLRTSEITGIFNTIEEIYLVFTSKK